MAKKFRKTLNTENCDEFSLSADGPDIDVDDSKEGLLELTIKYPLHTLHVEAEELREAGRGLGQVGFSRQSLSPRKAFVLAVSKRCEGSFR